MCRSRDRLVRLLCKDNHVKDENNLAMMATVGKIYRDVDKKTSHSIRMRVRAC
jgi:hypothetical protein